MAGQDLEDTFALAALQETGRALLSIDGLWCPSCAAATERVIRAAPGVFEASVSFATSAVLLRWDASAADLSDIARRVAKLGYRIGPPVGTDETVARIDREVGRLSIRLAVAVLFGMWTMLLSLLLYLGNDAVVGTETGWWIALAASVVSIPVVIFAGWPIFLAGWRTLRTGVPGMDALVSLGVLASLGLSYWQLTQGRIDVYFDTAVMLIGLLTVGRLIEVRTLRHAARAIGALQDVLPETAVRISADGKANTVPAKDVSVGECIQIQAGQRIPLDGEVVSGGSQLDRSVLTGESLPNWVSVASPVEAGCINLTSALVVKVTRGVGEREIDRIGARVAEAAGAKGGTQRLADNVARFIVPAALVLALVALLFGLLTGESFQDALLRGVSVLVIACPCAVGIAVPVAYVAAASQAARQGILFRHPAALEALAGVRAVFFDKTGTLTAGRLAVSRVTCHVLDDARFANEEAVIALAAKAELGIDHAIARAVRKAAGLSQHAVADDASPERFERGVRYHDAQHGVVLLGTRDFLYQQGVAQPATKIAEVDNGTAMAIEMAVSGRWLATIELEDSIRDDAAEAILRLREAGIACRIVTGDSWAPAQAVASQLGIASDHVHAGCSPSDKASLVRASTTSVAFAGDGVNDAPALVEADVGLAVADATTTATAAASVAVANGGVARIADAVLLSQRARTVMRQNMFFSIAYNAIGLSLAVAGTIPPVVAVLAMTASSLSVVLNATRLSSSPAVK
ncbi:heavy metal translocating P-type ATPase [Halomonas korlensis]|uniref:Cu+-exporting ATPase n=1 Tax=Halomonas korlensis TaxID=463301 RepID=A0A1I7IBX9_9GAMM|nr:cation-translocating P-type ATPase [Halomonas korlensis]SFU70427.1 Cu+-exporting ATPase [Halomonas korlensis]